MIDWTNYPNFSRDEFDSKDLPGSGDNMQREQLNHLQRARNIAGIPFKINSGFRTPEHNKKVGGKPNSAHLRGWATDIQTPDAQTRYKVLHALFKVGYTRIGIYDNFVHCDCDPSLPQNVIWV